jgi:electron transport complex protein RnfG
MKEQNDVLSILKLGLVLALFSTVACVALAFVYAGTETQIAANQTAKLNDGLKDIFGDQAVFEEITVNAPASNNTAVTFNAAYSVKTNGTVSGIVINAQSQGFQDALIALVGVGADGKIVGVRLLQDKDTPGLGAKAAEPQFYGQFTGMDAAGDIRVKKDGGIVDQVTAATISSRAVSLIVKTAVGAGLEWLTGGGK